MRVRWLLLVIVCWTVGTGPARAEPTAGSTAAEEQARALFVQGQQALAAGQLVEARDFFRRSLDLHERPATAFNLAVALQQTGETSAAVATFDDLLTGRYGELSTQRAEEVENLRAVAFAELATLYIQVNGASEAQIRIDGRRDVLLQDGQRIQRHLVAGEHVVSASAAGYVTVERALTLERGGSQSVVLHLVLAEPIESPEDAVLPPAHPPAPDPPQRRAVVQRPWFWIVVGVVVSAAAVGIWAGVARPWEQDLARDPVFPVVHALQPGQ